MRDCVKFHGEVFSCASVYAPNSIMQCLLKLMVVPVMSVHGDILENMPLFIGSALIKNCVFYYAGDNSVWELF